MKLPLSWLKEYLPKLPAPQALADVLMMHGLEVEEITDRSGEFKNVMVGEIVAIRKHPNADKLRLADVILEPSGKPQEIVCGAPNIEIGQKVPVALLGAQLPNGITIERRQIRGIFSNGMICAEDELGLGTNHAGIMVLDSKLSPGTPFSKAIGIDAVVFDLAIPANRSDLFSVRGLAREIGAIVGQKPKMANNKTQKANLKSRASVSVTVSDKKLCPLYTARVIRGVKVQPSPHWLQTRLRAAGMRPINAAVDATNYVMLEYGQPLHAFDAATLNDRAIIVRTAKQDEHLITLDQKSRPLDASMLVIADAKRPIALAGVMGGAHTEISDATTDIILESAIFDPVSIRKTSWKLGLQSEASRRFEKGLPLTLPEEASTAAAALITKLCGGTVDPGSVAVGTLKSKLIVVTMKPKVISDLLGMSVKVAKSKALLTRLGFKIIGTTTWKITVPSWRLDVSTVEDIADEVGRMVGYDDIPEQLPPGKINKKEIPAVVHFKDEVRNILVDLGFSEVISHAFCGTREAAGDSGEHFAIANPLDTTQHVLRKRLSPQIEDVLTRQADAGHDAMIFEIGRVFDPNLKGDVTKLQPWKVALGLAHKGVDQTLQPVVTEIQKRLQVQTQPKIVLAAQPIRGRTLEYCELDLAELMGESKLKLGPWDPSRYSAKDVRYREQSKYPAITRDISFWISQDLAKKDWIKVFFDDGFPLLFSVNSVGQYERDNQYSLAFRLTFQSAERTLTKAEVDAIMDRLTTTITSLGATIR